MIVVLRMHLLVKVLLLTAAVCPPSTEWQKNVSPSWAAVYERAYNVSISHAPDARGRIRDDENYLFRALAYVIILATGADLGGGGGGGPGGPMSQENLLPGNCVAATVFPQEIMLLTINVATVYPKEILSSPNTTYTTASFLL